MNIDGYAGILRLPMYLATKNRLGKDSQHLLFALHSQADQRTAICSTTVGELAGMTGIDKISVGKSLIKLRRCGLVIYKTQKHEFNKNYFLTLFRLNAQDKKAKGTPVTLPYTEIVINAMHYLEVDPNKNIDVQVRDLVDDLGHSWRHRYANIFSDTVDLKKFIFEVESGTRKLKETGSGKTEVIDSNPVVEIDEALKERNRKKVAAISKKLKSGSKG